MHIIIGFLTSVLTILYLLDRLGVDIGYLNPFTWMRRRAWAKKYEGDPVYAIEDPMEVAALLITGMARVDGDITAEQKSAIREAFSSTFSLGDKEANELLVSSTHLLGAPQIIHNQLEGVLKRTGSSFNRSQADSIMDIINRLYPEPLSHGQQELRAVITELLPTDEGPNTEWAT